MLFQSHHLIKWIISYETSFTRPIFQCPSSISCRAINSFYTARTYLIAIVSEPLPLLSVRNPFNSLDIVQHSKQSVPTIPAFKKICRKTELMDKKWTGWSSPNFNCSREILECYLTRKERTCMEDGYNGTSEGTGQLGCLLQDGLNILLTPVNLRRMRIQYASFCPLCSHLRSTTTYIDQGRYAWHHDFVLLSKVKQLATIPKHWCCNPCWYKPAHILDSHPSTIYTTQHSKEC